MRCLILTLFIATNVQAAGWYQQSGRWVFNTLPEWFDILDTCKTTHAEPNRSDYYDTAATACNPSNPYWQGSSNDPTKGICVRSNTNRFPPEIQAGMAAFEEAKDAASRAKRKCITDGQKALIAQHPVPEGVDENWDSMSMTGDGYADQVQVWDSTKVKPRDPCGLTLGGVAPAHCSSGSSSRPAAAQQQALAASQPDSAGDEEAREPAGEETADLPEGGSCDPEAARELARKYAKAYNIILAVQKQKMESFGCGGQ